MRAALRLLLQSRISSRIQWLNYDGFTDIASAPLSSPLASGWTVVQLQGYMSIDAGGLQLPAQTGTPAQTKLGLYSANYARQPGRVLYAKMKRSGVGAGFYPYLAWALTAGTLPTSLSNTELSLAFLNGGVLDTHVLDQQVLGWAGYRYYLPNVDYEFALIERSTGGYICLRGGVLPNWQLVAVLSDGATATLKAVLNTFNGEASTVRALGIGDLLDTRWTADYGLATSRVAAPTTGATATMTKDAVVEFTWTPAASEILEISVRMTDADNRWIWRCDQANSTLKLFERNAGTETQRATKAKTWTAGTAYRFQLFANYLTHTCVVDNVWQSVTYRDSTFNHEATGVMVAGFATGSNLACYPMNLDIPIPVTGVTHRIKTVGDSKIESFVPGWQPYLLDSLGAGWVECLQYAHSGWTVAQLRANQDAFNSHIPSGVVPDYVLVNAGANELLTTIPSEATWNASLGALLDAEHALAPNALVIVSYPWVATKDVGAATLKSRIDTVLSTRSAWAIAGVDEAVVIKAGDDGATNTSDGTHYSNPAGNTAYAAAMQAVMGY